jgi:peptidyl-prolyl cis-trans isomerase D
MMRSLRAMAPWMMGILALTFIVGWLILDVGADITGRSSGAVNDEVARINGQKIDMQTFYTALRNAQAQQRAQGGSLPETLEEQRALEDAVLEQLVQQVLLQQEYARRRITVSDEEVRQAMLNAPPADIRQIPEFQTDSQFDLQKYQRYLNSGADPAFVLALEARYREELPRLKLLERLTSDVFVSDAELWRAYRDRHDSITIRLVTLLPQLAAPDSALDVGPEAVRSYYRSHQADFRQPAQAFLSYVAVSRVPDAADSAAALHRAEAFLGEIGDGADFGEVARRESADSASAARGGDLGEARRGDFVPAFEQAALALRPGQVSEPVLSPFGYHLIKLESRTGDSYHARHILISVELQGDHLDQVDARADSLDFLAAAQDDPALLDTVAARLGLVVQRVGPLLEGSEARAGDAAIPDAAIWAFEAQPGEISEVIETHRAYYLFRLDSLRPAGVPPLEEIEGQVRQAAVLAAQWEATRGIARAIAADLAAGTSLAAAAEARDLPSRSLGPFTRTAPPPVLREAPAAIGAAFGLPLGKAGGPLESDQAIFFVEPTARQPTDSAAFVRDKDRLGQEILFQKRQARVQIVFASLRESATVVDRRRELARAQRAVPDVPFSQAPGGF